MKTTTELKGWIEDTPMTRYQWLIVSICILVYTIDGFDILVMAFTAHSVSQSWGLNGSQIGFLISSGLIGAALGSFFIAPFGDKIGRKKTIVYSLFVASISMLLSAYASSATELAILRFVTGVCIGGVLSNCNVMASEYSSFKWKSLTICLLSTGYALGATFGGLLAMYLDKHLGWQIVFLAGGILTVMTMIIVAVGLPESLFFLLNRQPQNYLNKVSVIQKRMNLPDISAIEKMQTTMLQSKSNFASIFKKDVLSSTLLLWLAMFSMMFGFYYILTWTPKILSGSGMSNEQGISVGVLINFGAVIGTLLFGFLGARYKIKNLQVIFLILTAIFTAIFALFLKNLNLALMIGVVVGVFGVGAKAGIQVVAPMIYDATNRATGVGFAIGVGRLGSMLSPIVAGVLLDAGWTPMSLFLFASAFFIVAMFAMLTMKKNS